MGWLKGEGLWRVDERRSEQTRKKSVHSFSGSLP